MLKYPAKNFGRFPTPGFLFKACGLMATMPTLSGMPWHRLNGTKTAPETPETFWSAVQTNKRLRYAKRHLDPFLARQYGIKLPMKTAEDLGRIMRSELIIPLNSDKEYYLLGWDHIENAASRTEPVENLSKTVHLARVQNGAMTEAPRWDETNRGEPATFSQDKSFTSLEQTEQNIKTMIMDLIKDLPNSQVEMEVMAMGEDDLFENVGASMEMEIVDGNLIVETETDFDILTDTAVFSARVAGKCLLILSIELDEKTFICAYLIYEDGYGLVDKNSLSSMLTIQNAEPGEIVFIDDLADLKSRH